MNELAQRVEKRLREPLPGYAAMVPFAPELSFGRHAGPPPATARAASVLSLFCKTDSTWVLPLTLRPAHLPDHGGQVCFPGGSAEPHESDQQTAIREAEEELGIQGGDVRIVGRLTPVYVFATNFWVTPFVGMMDYLPDFKPCEREVDEIILVTLKSLFDPSSQGRHRIVRHGMTFEAPHVEAGEHRIWGATSMMLAELTAALGELDFTAADVAT